MHEHADAFTFAVCFELILPPTLHQLRPEQFFQPAIGQLKSTFTWNFQTFLTHTTAEKCTYRSRSPISISF